MIPRGNTSSILLTANDRLWALGAAALALIPLLLQLPNSFGLIIVAIMTGVSLLSWRTPPPRWLRVIFALAALVSVLMTVGANPGRDTGCALLAAMLAVKPSETFSLRDVRSLLGFALFAPFAAFLLDQGPATTALGLGAVLCVLLLLQRFSDIESETHTLSPVRRIRLIGRMLLIGLPLALAAFWLFPRFPAPLWGIPQLSQAQMGLSGSMRPGDWLDLMVDETPAFRVDFSTSPPRPEQMYWRGPTLWAFDGSEWTRALWLPSDSPGSRDVISQDVHWDYTIAYEPTDRHYLVALDLPLEAPADAYLASDHTLTSRHPLNNLTRWQLRSAPPAQYQLQLPSFQRRAALQLPPGYNPRTLQLARQLRDQYGDNDTALIQHVMEWIRTDFAYTLDTPLPGRNAVDEFLFDQQQGYCEHFSSSFVFLMRAAGIPARVVTGFAGGSRNPLGGYWIVRRMDAHAWAEAWLPQRGWVRFDPTAAVAPERIYDTVNDRLRSGAEYTIWSLSGLSDLRDWMRRGWNDFVLGFDANRQTSLLKPFGIPQLHATQLGILFALCMTVILVWMIWLLRRRERERDPLLRAWRKVGKRYTKLGLDRDPSEPALVWVARIAHEHPQSAMALSSLSLRFVELRYAGSHEGVAELIKDLRRHRP
ncbi:MAG: DUF3488 and transglutaminase-like domain-containing protein [Xanthomonadaceae bacterium]|jgi:transglutaminase-like putative cysteine protease|nr:DUF3488 and transglutaminase-like domain-containing protein [Xanthomonadaceae bacterium]